MNNVNFMKYRLDLNYAIENVWFSLFLEYSFLHFLLLQKVEGGLVDNYIAVIAAPVCYFFWLASSVLKIPTS